MSLPQKETWDNFYTRFSPEKIAARAGKIGIISEIEDFLFINDKFFRAIGNPKHQNILSLGGGLDILALGLAQKGARMTCLDISPLAAEKTRAAANLLGLRDNFSYSNTSCEKINYNDEFDLCLTHRSLHHLNIKKIIPLIRAALRPGGRLLAQEPVCLSSMIRTIHRLLPFHPNYPFDPQEEHELTPGELDFIRSQFSSVSLEYFECFSRNSLAFFIYQLGGRRIVYNFSKADYFLVRWLPVLKWLSTYCIITAKK